MGITKSIPLKRFFIALTLLGILVTVNYESQTTQGAAAACVDCHTDCDRASNDCQYYASGAYVTCGQNGGSEEACKKARNDAYSSCMSGKGCDRCRDTRWGNIPVFDYCRCLGYPSGRAPNTLETADYSDPYQDDGWADYCNTDPCACDPGLMWCGGN